MAAGQEETSPVRDCPLDRLGNTEFPQYKVERLYLRDP